MIDVILFIIGIILIVAFFIFLIKDYINNRKTVILLKSKLFKYFVSFFGIIIIALITVNFVKPHTTSLTPNQQIQYGNKYKNYLLAASGYNYFLKENPDNFQLNYKYINCFYEQIKVFNGERKTTFEQAIEKVKESHQFYESINYYHHIIDKETDIKMLDIAHLFLTYNFLNTNDLDLAEFHFKNIFNKNRPFYNFIEGYYHYKIPSNVELKTITSLLNKSIDEDIAVKHSVEILSEIYYSHTDNSKLNLLIENQKTESFVPFYIKRMYYLSNYKYISYFFLLIKHDFSNAYWLGAIFAFIISLIWIIYLKGIDIFEKDKWYQLSLVFLLSCFSIYLIYPYHDYILNWLNYKASDNWLSQFILDFVSIGVIEEIVKIIPVLIILKFTKFINEPYDYILYASVSALGFAFIENLQYLAETSINNINARLLFAAVGHMFFTSIWAYLMLLAKYYYRFKYKMIIMFLLGWILAALAHAFYDFWLIHFDNQNYHQLTTIFLILSVQVWAIMKNNALNISNYYKTNIHVDNEKMNFFLITSLWVVFMSSFVTVSFINGQEYGYSFLLSNLFSYFFFIIYLSFTFSKYEIIRGHIKKLNPTKNFLFFKQSVKKDILTNCKSITLFKTRVNHLDYVTEANYKYDILPLKGEIIEKLIIDKNPIYYLVKTHTTLNLNKYNNNYIVIYKQKAKTNNKNKILVKVLLINPHINLKTNTYKKSDFKLLGYSILQINND